MEALRVKRLKTCKEDVSRVTAERNTYEALRDGALEQLLIATSDIQCKEVAVKKLEQELQVCVAVLRCVAVCCGVLQSVALCYTVLHCVRHTNTRSCREENGAKYCLS